MTIHLQYLQESHLDICVTLWNEDFRNLYPLTHQLMKQNSNEQLIFKNGSFLICDHDRTIGFVISKINKEINTGHIQIIYIQKEYRNNGIGTMLLHKI